MKTKSVFHPVLQTTAFMMLMVLINKLFPGADFEAAWARRAAFGSFAIGLTLGIFGGGLLERSRTTSDPLKADQSTTLVTRGIYRFTRNPMYLGFVFILLAVGFFVGNAASFVAVPVYITSMTLLQIFPEERALTACFGDAYRQYQARVRRWL
ncbi:MAG: isoprenylcysteine carboxylmethyltransferase family protein [Wenzhouxiangellaceae bacterium]